MYQLPCTKSRGQQQQSRSLELWLTQPEWNSGCDFESFLGHLSHAAMVIRQGRTFLKHLFDILAGACSRYHYVHLDNMAKADLWWKHFLQRWNGRMFFRQFERPVIHIYTDASGSFGCGGVVVPSSWFHH